MAKYNVQEFAELIKTEYPDYAEMDDLELTKMVVSEYPEYEVEVDIEGDDKKKKKKKDEWQPNPNIDYEALPLMDKERANYETWKQKQTKSDKPVTADKVASITPDKVDVLKQGELDQKVKANNIKNVAQEIIKLDTEGPGEELTTTWEQEGLDLIAKQSSGEIANLNISKLRNQAVKSLMTPADKKRVENGQRPLNKINPQDVDRITKQLYVENKKGEWRLEQAEKIYEKFETDFGTDRTSDLYTILDEYSEYTPIKGIKTIRGIFNVARDLYNKDLEKREDQSGWDFVLDAAAYVNGTREEKESLDNRKELYKELNVAEKEIEEEYLRLNNDVVGAAADVNIALEDVKRFEKRIKEKDPTFTQQDYDYYITAFESLNKAQSEYEKALYLFQEAPVPSNNLETIINLSLKNYDNLAMVENNIANSITSLASGLAVAAHELTVPELMKWAGVDIESEEGLDTIFGEGEEGVVGVLKETARAAGDVNESVGKAIRQGFELSDAIKDRNAPVVRFDDIKTTEDFAMWGMDMMSGQVVNTALTIAIPPAGLILMSVGEAGRKMNEMNVEIEGIKDKDGNWIVEPQDINAAQYFTTAALYGGIEYVTEKVSLGILTGVSKNVQKAFKVAGKGRPNISLKNLTTTESWGKFGLDFTTNSFKESGAEGLVTLVNNATDIHILGKKDIGYFDGITESMMSGFLMGNTFQAPTVFAQVAKSFSSEGEYAKANKLNAKLIELSQARDKEGLSLQAKQDIQTRIDKIIQQQFTASQDIKNRAIEMTPKDRDFIMEFSDDLQMLRNKVDATNEDATIDDNTKATLINGYTAEIQELESLKERIFSKYANIERSKQAVERATKLVEDADLETDIVSVKDETDFAKALEDEGLDAKEAKQQAESSFGIYQGTPDPETGRRKIFLNEAEIAKVDKWTTAQHEVLHRVLEDVLKFDRGDVSRVALGNAIKEKLQEIDPKTLGDTEFAKYFLEYRNEDEGTKGEELVTLFSEGVATGDIKFDEGFFTKIGDLIRRIFQNIAPNSRFGKIKFNSAKDVYKFVKDYNTSFEKGKFTRAQKKAIKKGVVPKRTGKMDFANEFLDVEFKNSKGEPVKLKFAKKLSPEKTTAVEQSILDLKQEIKENEDIAKKFGKEPIPTAKQQRLEQSILKDQLKPTIDSFVESQTKRLFDPIAPDARNNVTRQAFRESMVSDIETMIVKEFEQKQDIEKFITSRGYLRANSLAKRLGIKSVEQGIDKDIDQAKGIAAETETVTVDEKKPTKQIKLKERLGDDAVKITEEVKERGKDIDLETVDFKTLKDLTPEMTQEMFGISPKPGNLSKADVRNAQQFISKNADVLIAMLPEGATPSGTSTGVQKVLLDAFYTKGDRAAMAKTGSKAGLQEQTKRDNITKEEFNELFGITPAGQPNLSDRNTSSRIKALVTQTGRMLTNQAIREQAEAKGKEIPSKIFEGKSKLMFAKKLSENYERQVQNLGSSFNNLSTENKIEFNSKLDDFINALSVGYSVDAAFQDAYGNFLNKKDGTPNNQRIKIIQGWKKVNDFIFDQQRKLNDGKPNIDKVQEYLYQSFSEQTERQVYQEILGLKKRSIDFSNREQIISYVSALSEFIGSKIQDGRLRTDRDLVDYAENVLGPLLTSSSKTGDGSLRWNVENGVWDLVESGKKGSTRYSVFSNKGEMMDVLIKPFLKDKKSYSWTSTHNISKDGVRTKSGKLLYKGESLLNNEFKGFRSQTVNLYLKDYAADGKISNRTLNKSETFAKFNRSTVLEILKFLKEKSNDPESQITKNDLGMFFMESNGDMKAPLRASANVDGIAVDESLKPGNYRYEHNPPARTMLVHMANYVNGKIDLEQLNKEFDNFSVTIIPLSMDEVINLKYKDTIPIGGETRKYRRYYNTFTFGAFPFSTIEYVKQDNGTYKQVVHGAYQAEAYKKVQPAKKKNVTNLKKSKVVKTSDQAPNSEDIRQAEVLDKALNIARDPNAPVKKIRVFDFDDTLARTKSNVLYTMPGEVRIYHGGSVKTIKDIDGISYFSENQNQAKEYAKGNEGEVQSFIIKENNIASEDIVYDEINRLNLKAGQGFDVNELNLYELIDLKFDTSLSKSDLNKLIKSLKSKGIKAIRFRDMNLQTLKNDINNIMVFDKNVIQNENKLTAEEFAKKGDKMLAEGAVWDFSEFNKVMEGREGPLLGVAKLIQQARGTKDVFVLTARAQEAAPAIKEFLDSVGLNIPIENITGLGDSSPLAKSNWIVDKAADGYNDFYFADDHMGNVDAVQKALAVMEAKGKVQQAKIKFSLNTKRDLKWKNIGGSFNIEEANFEVNGKDYQIEIKNKGVGHIFSKLEHHFKSLGLGLTHTQELADDNLRRKELSGDKPSIIDAAFYRITESYDTESGIDKDVDLTGEGNAAEVMSIVANGLVDKYNKTKGAQGVTFTAFEKSRVRLYRTLANIFSRKLGLKVLETEFDGIDGMNVEFLLLNEELFKSVKDPARWAKRTEEVQKVLDVVDVKSDVQKDKLKFSKTVDQVMNTIIFQKTGIQPYKEFAEVTAQARGRKKKSWNLIPPSAQDFGGLLYNLLGKGEVGNQQWQWMQEHLIKPYGRAMNDLSVAQNQLMADFRALKESLSGVPKNLKKEAFGGFTNEDVVRVATWDRQGIEIDGISKRDLDAVRKYVANKPDLNIFIDQLIAITKGDGYYYPGKNWLAGTITTDFREGLRKVTRKNLLEQWQSNIDLAFNENTMNKLEAAFGPKYREALENSLERMSSGQNRRQGMSRLEQRFLDYINNSVGAVMFLNARSAVLQTISAANFINWKDNNPIKAGIAFANQPQYWKDFMKLMNSDFLVDRRNGLKINVSESEIAEAAKTSKNTVKGVITYLLNKGFAFTQIADSFAIATGGATFYRNRIKTYKKEGLSEAEATEKAFLEFRELAEESQQSARADKISQQQASTLGRLVLAFANTPSQYARIMEKAGRDLINNRGDWKANMSKIAYYGFVQNLLFTTLQSALFAYGMDDDEEEDAKVFPENKMLDTANSMADNILRGLGVAGVVLAQSKNTIIDLVKRSERDPYFNPDAEAFPGPDYEDAVMKLLAISPPVSIKLRKIRGGITDWYFNRWRPEASEPFNINNPSYRAGSKVIAGITNVPLDRLFQKMENIQGVFDDTNPTWQRVFMALGWPKWQLETEKEKEKRKAKEKKQRKDLRAKDNPSIYTKDEQVNILKQYKLTDEEIKELKNEDLRVKKIQQLRDSTKVTHVPMAATVKPKAKPVNIKASLTPTTKKSDSTSYKPSSKVKPTSVSIPKKKQTRKKIALKDRTKRQARLYKLKKSDQLDTLKSLGLSGGMLDALKYEEDRVRKIEELYDKNK